MAEHEESPGGVPPLDEEAAWAAIVAGYGQEPPDPPGARPFRPIENLMLPEEDVKPEPSASEPDPEPPALGSSVVFAPGVGIAGPGPRDHSPAEPADSDTPEAEAGEEGHFVQPEPELPQADTTTKFAWLAVVGGPVLLLLAVLLQWDMTWWLTTLGIGGFLGGFATLVGRMSQGDDDDDDPGRGAVV
ncbi:MULTISPECIES: hypothetical protein [unclassified Streptomyces]|uniref:hypothetical protein n=1 Tax=unclassified Streptomyces TaxID=2593676 RepID=UPI002255C152|nr:MULTISPECIES: hypothetical protein [unclassified Streptomyces]MCX4525476.1 hypothetical protein [Streptomyces sp. NBC_01551]MCX4544052.1 hypothetical protein [Streptomyces sp. NBC_01565]